MLSFQGNGKVFEYNGSFADYSTYISKTNNDEVVKATDAVSVSKNDWELKKKQKQEERKKQSRLEKIEKEIEAAEERIRKIDLEAEALSTDYVALQALFEEKESLEEKCNRLLEEWSALEDE